MGRGLFIRRECGMSGGLLIGRSTETRWVVYDELARNSVQTWLSPEGKEGIMGVAIALGSDEESP